MRKFSKKSSKPRTALKRSLARLDKGLLAEDFMYGGLRILCKDTDERREVTRLLIEGGVPDSLYSRDVLAERSPVYTGDHELTLFFDKFDREITYYSESNPKRKNVVRFKDIARRYQYRDVKTDSGILQDYYRVR